MLRIDAVGGADIEKPTMRQNRAMGRVMCPDSKLGAHVEEPDDVRVKRRHLHGRIAEPRHVSTFVHKGSVVAVGLAIEIEAHHFVAVVHDIDAVLVDRGRRNNADFRPIRVALVLVLFGELVSQFLWVATGYPL